MGFTLVELMIVVAIIGLLATIAVPSFLRMRLKVKVSEAKANLGAIRVCEHAFFAEYNRFVGNQPYIPDRTLDPQGRLPWVVGTRFSILGYAPDGDVYFSYGLAGPDYPVAGFTAQATADLDADGDWAVWSITVGSKELNHQGGSL
jgi:type IV pilus assembly protein PilA